jgi:hypothetical protein
LDPEKKKWVDASLSDLIGRAANPKCRLLDMQLKEDARRVKKAGNNFVHGRVKDPRKVASNVLTKTRQILDQLYPKKL